MDTPAPLTRSRWLPRRVRIGVFVALIALVQGGLAYLLTWIDPPRPPHVVSIRVSSNPAWSVPRSRQAPNKVGTTRVEIEKTLASLSAHSPNEPVIVHLSAIALHGETGNILILPSDSTPDDPASWLPLREVLEKLRACPARHKLLVFEWLPPPLLDRVGIIYHDIAAALPGELEAVPDPNRLVVSACSAGQTTHWSDELGQSVFAHYLQQGLHGSADGYDDARDRRITVRELANFLQARVERWSLHNRGERQTPMLHGKGDDFMAASVDPTAPRPVAPAAPRLSVEDRLAEIGNNLHTRRVAAGFDVGLVDFGDRPLPVQAAKLFDSEWRLLEQRLATAKPADAERIKKRFAEDLRGKLPTGELDAVVFNHSRAESRFDPGYIRTLDHVVHSTPTVLPRTAETLRIKQLADLAMRIEVHAWPRDAIEGLLRSTDLGEKALKQTPHLPGYFELLEEPALMRHAGEVRLWARGHANLNDAQRLLTTSADQFDRLMKLNARWEKCTQRLDEAFLQLPSLLGALDTLTELRDPWQQAAHAARKLADELKVKQEEGLPWTARVENLTGQVLSAEKFAAALQPHLRLLHAPFAKDAVVKLERQCRSPQADGQVRQTAAALLSAYAPPLHSADDGAALLRAVDSLSSRLNQETLTLDRDDDDAQRLTPQSQSKTPVITDQARGAAERAGRLIALAELAGVTEQRMRRARSAADNARKNAGNMTAWCNADSAFRDLLHKGMREQFGKGWHDWHDCNRLEWGMPSRWLAMLGWKGVLPYVVHLNAEKERRDHWMRRHQQYLARDYAGLNLDSPGIVAARGFHAPALIPPGLDAHVTFGPPADVRPLTESQPYADVWVEVTRHVPPGAFGPLELRFHRPDEAWLDIAPESATLPALSDSKEARTVTSKVPVKVTRKAKAERSGLPAPLGFLVEARFEGRSFHQLVNAPIVASTQELQILVSADPDEPGTTVNDIRVRPGKVKQPHYVYLRNLTNRTQKVYVEVKAGDALALKSRLVTLEPDGTRRVMFDEATPAAELHGPLEVRVLDQERAKVLHERRLRVEILNPREYVRVAEVSFDPRDRWSVQVQATRTVPGPAIAAQLVLPVQRIPWLQAVGGGTLQVELPTHTKTPRTLFAERLSLLPSIHEEGPVYLHIDGVPRAFIYRTIFARTAGVTQPQPDMRPAVRLTAPPCVMAGVNCLIDVEVDNAPAGTKLEVALGRVMDDGTFKSDVIREFIDAKKHRIGVESSKGALIFDASIADWTATFDTRSVAGPRAVRARLIDSAGTALVTAEQSMVIDDTPPIARIAATPAQVKRGSVVQLQASAVDPESGVAQVVFFFGRPDKGEIPNGAPRFKAVPANRELTQWTAPLLMPLAHKGPLAVSVQVVNHAGMATIDTVLLDVTDREPGKTGLGEIRGQVTEGPRPQPNLTVTLFDETGKQVAQARTQADGSYVFTQLAPGRYRVVCVKPESQRRATLNVPVEADKGSRADLALTL